MRIGDAWTRFIVIQNITDEEGEEVTVKEAFNHEARTLVFGPAPCYPPVQVDHEVLLSNEATIN